jgi:hypothetical protein
MNWKHMLMLACGGAAALATWEATGDPTHAAIWQSIATGAVIVGSFFGLNSPAAFGKDAKK